MKIKQGYILRKIVGAWIIVPAGNRVLEFNGLMNLSESGALIWNKLIQGSDEQELVAAIMQEYDIDEITAKADVKEYITLLQERGLLEEWA